MFFGSEGGIRTHNLSINSRVLRLWATSEQKIGYVLLSQEAALQVLSAMQGLTSVFGMGTGVSPTLL